MSAPLTVTTEFVVAYAGYSSISLGAAATEAPCIAINNSSTSFDIVATRKPKLEQQTPSTAEKVDSFYGALQSEVATFLHMVRRYFSYGHFKIPRVLVAGRYTVVLWHTYFT